MSAWNSFKLPQRIFNSQLSTWKKNYWVTRSPKHLQSGCRGDSFRVEWVAGIPWNQWQTWSGIRSLMSLNAKFDLEMIGRMALLLTHPNSVVIVVIKPPRVLGDASLYSFAASMGALPNASLPDIS